MDRILASVELILSIANEAGARALVVGGVVRDLLLGKPQQDDDLDVTIEGDVFQIAQEFARRTSGRVQCYPEFLSAKVLLEGQSLHEVDFVATRKEVYATPGALPTVGPGSLEDDIRRRDFSVNAMALPLGYLASLIRREVQASETLTQLVDPLLGWHDLQSRSIRVLHERSFLDDPTRLFRAARYAARLGGSLESYTQQLLREAVAAGALRTISLTRRVNELCRVAEEQSEIPVVAHLYDWGILAASDLVLPDRLSDFSRAARKLIAGGAEKRVRVQLMYLALGTTSSVGSPEQFFKNLGLPKQIRKEFLMAMEPSATSSLAVAYRNLFA